VTTLHSHCTYCAFLFQSYLSLYAKDVPKCQQHCTIIYALLAKRVVKMAGYWPSVFCVFMDRDEVEAHKHAKKKNEVNIHLIIFK